MEGRSARSARRRPGAGRSGSRAALLSGLLLLAVAPLGAQELRPSRWTVRSYALALLPDDGEVRGAGSPAAGERTRFSLGDGGGLGLELEYRPRRRWGFEAAALFSDLDAEYAVELSGLNRSTTRELGVRLFTLGANYHLRRERRFELHVGGFAALGYFDDLNFTTATGRRQKFTFDDDLGFGVKLGLDAPLFLQGRWRLHAALRYLVTILESEVAGQDLDIDPLIPSIGVGYRF